MKIDILLKQRMREFLLQELAKNKAKVMSPFPVPIIVQAHEMEQFLDAMWVHISNAVYIDSIKNNDHDNETTQ